VNNRPSVFVLLFRYFMTMFVITFLSSLFWNTLSGINMFPFPAVIGSAVFLTVLFNVVGWVVSTIGAEVLLKDNDNYKRWKQMGGRPYWDSIGWPINTATPIERQTGLSEPQYTGFVPPPSWQYQCPVCGSRVEKQIDVCWNCNYGANGDSSAYTKRWHWSTFEDEQHEAAETSGVQVPSQPTTPLGQRPVT